MNIVRYSHLDEEKLFDLLKDEGSDWEVYYGEENRAQYIKALQSSITFILYDNEVLVGYVRCREDDGFGLYVYDLLVRKTYRGHGYGRLLMEDVARLFPNQVTYVMSDEDPYYEKLGYHRVGSIFEVK